MNELELGFLAHHGILGQKWGKRQGPPYPLDEEDHSAVEKKEGYEKSIGGGRNENLYDRKEKAKAEIKEAKEKAKKKLSERREHSIQSTSKSYQKRYDMTKEQADEEAAKRYDTVKKIAIGMGITAGTAAAIYAARKIGRSYVDDVIKAGTSIQTLQHDSRYLDQNTAFYAAYRKLDKFKYLGGFGKSTNAFGMPVGDLKKKVLITNQKDIKIAGELQAKKTFKKLLKDPDFAKAAGTRNYTKFNTYGLLNGHGSVTAQDMFYDALKKKGYGAVRDLNDAKNSGFNTKAAIIFDKNTLGRVGPAGQILDKKVSKIRPDDYKNARKWFNVMTIGDSLLTPRNVAIGTAFVGTSAINEYDKKVDEKYRKKGNTDANRVSKK